MFSRDFLCDMSYDEAVLSFLKDWVFIRTHPQEKNNMFIVFFVFWILNFVSVNLTYKYECNGILKCCVKMSFTLDLLIFYLKYYWFQSYLLMKTKKTLVTFLP
jgi:uncharacterized membrane protein